MFLVPVLTLSFISLSSLGFFKSAEYLSLGKEQSVRNLLETNEDYLDHYGSFAHDADEGFLYVGSPDGSFFKIEIDPFRIVKKINQGTRSNIGLYKDHVYFVDTNGVLNSLKKKDLSENYRLFVGKTFSSLPSFDEKGRLFLMLEDETVLGIEASTGKILWRFRRSTSLATTIRGNFQPFLWNNRLIVGSADGYIVSLRPEDGTMIKEEPLFTSRFGKKYLDVDGPPMVLPGNRLLISYFDGDLCLFDLNAFTVISRMNGGSSREVFVSGNTLVSAASNGVIHQVDLKSYKEIWRNSDRPIPSTKPIMFKDSVYLFRMQRYLDILDSKSGKVKSTHDLGRMGGFYSDPILIQGNNRTDIFIINQGRKLIDYRID